ncbi:MAG: hypothetical protein IK079_01170 [Desulfovibrio sp.]|nr:hypothetical protein [Desulfovibrio sp.]
MNPKVHPLGHINPSLFFYALHSEKVYVARVNGSWLNVAEIGLSVLKSQCLDERVDSLEKMRSKVSAWVDATNACTKKIDWQFSTEDARIKLKRLYPVFL